jgi:hypothetical protein
MVKYGSDWKSKDGCDHQSPMSDGCDQSPMKNAGVSYTY